MGGDRRPRGHVRRECCALAGQALDALVNVLDDAGLGDPESVDLRTAVLPGLVTQQISDDPGG